MADAAAAAKPGSDFVAQLEAANLHPLWDRFRTLTAVKPQAFVEPIPMEWHEKSEKEFDVPNRGTDAANFDIETKAAKG